ncbi:MAG TPA: LCP family protein [Solirubrobacteraceae bacterium]|nr:LCP family protein [Solirubrobacteraceae bacterium]
MKLVPKTRGGALWRFALAAVLVIGFTAATTAVAGLLKVKQIEDYFNQTSAIKGADVQLPSPGAPETLLLIGSDHRAGTSYSSANTDTMMLVRIDDNSSTINMLSIPRDLRVQLPDGTAKLNAAYSEGGPNLLIKTLKQQVFPGLVVNHILDLNFGGFQDLVNAIGCVYTDVDHRYYNNTAQTDYSSIDIQPGYQKLCGTQALEFVRFRHTDSDIVRNARQQDFIRWAKDQFSISQLLSEEDKLLKIFGAHVQTDHFLHTEDGLIDLFDLVINADKLTLKQIPFPAVFLPCGGGDGQTPCYVTSTPGAMESAYQKFMTPTTANATTSSKHKGAGKAHKTPTAGLTSDVTDARNQALDLGKLGFPIYYPKLLPAATDEWQPTYCTSASGNCDEYPNPGYEYNGAYPRAYHIHGEDGGVYPAYRITVMLNSALGDYYGIQGTTWLHPPILNATSSTENVNGKLLQIFKNGAHVSLVAWRTPLATYWVSNTLEDALSNNQMIGIAASLTEAP